MSITKLSLLTRALATTLSLACQSCSSIQQCFLGSKILESISFLTSVVSQASRLAIIVMGNCSVVLSLLPTPRQKPCYAFQIRTRVSHFAVQTASMLDH